ncbi:MAG: phosphoribosylformylglycinamidine cyclo-ligase [Deltaproteobacteria bacterium]|nr:phosphoribosylformylglycinamidine cyclo-ligase [Deltaproteobacteria bacterium]
MAAITYKDAGVDIERGDALVDRITGFAKRTHRPGVLAGIGGFGALFSLKELGRFEDPVLVTGCDGVGTKLKLAFMANAHKTVGIDLVAMSVNDILCQGADPLFFLDYFATGKLDVEQAAAVVEGIAEGCMQAGCALVGGETAELPGFYASGEYDLAGFAVGVVEKKAILPRPDVVPGDIVLGLPSSGLHSNGYSLARKLVFDVLGLSIDGDLPQNVGKVKDVLMTPTRIYVKPVLEAVKRSSVKAIAHITGGGLIENVPRVLPPNTKAVLSPVAWPMPKLFSVLQAASGAAPAEMFRTFNMGIGLVLVVAEAHAAEVERVLKAEGETVYRLGQVEAGIGEPVCILSGVNG